METIQDMETIHTYRHTDIHPIQDIRKHTYRQTIITLNPPQDMETDQDIHPDTDRDRDTDTDTDKDKSKGLHLDFFLQFCLELEGLQAVDRQFGALHLALFYCLTKQMCVCVQNALPRSVRTQKP